MRVFTYSEARQRLAEVLDLARKGTVLIRRRDGDTFVVSHRAAMKSPFDVPGVSAQATAKEILHAVRTARRGRR
jgi:hypothetical protein